MYEALIRSTTEMNERVFDEVAAYYSGFATSLGIADQLPGKALKSHPLLRCPVSAMPNSVAKSVFYAGH